MTSQELHLPPPTRFDHQNALGEQESAKYLAKLESKHNRLKGKDGGKPTAHGMVKELSQAREDHLSNFLSSDSPHPHSSAWGAQDATRDRPDDDKDSDEDTWSIDSEKQNCCSCLAMPHKRSRPKHLMNADDETEVNLCLVESDELSQQHEEAQPHEQYS